MWNVKDSDTEVQLWIDGVQIVEVVAGTLSGSGKVALTAGVLYPIELKMVHKRGLCSIEVRDIGEDVKPSWRSILYL